MGRCHAKCCVHTYMHGVRLVGECACSVLHVARGGVCCYAWTHQYLCSNLSCVVMWAPHSCYVCGLLQVRVLPAHVMLAMPCVFRCLMPQLLLCLPAAAFLWYRSAFLERRWHVMCRLLALLSASPLSHVFDAACPCLCFFMCSCFVHVQLLLLFGSLAIVRVSCMCFACCAWTGP